MTSQPDSDPGDAAAFAEFTKNLPVETAAIRRERRDASANGIKRARWEIQAYSLGAGAGSATATLVFRPMLLLPSIQIAAGAIIGSLVGSVALTLYVLVSYLRHGGWLSEERVNVVPTIWFYGPLGAIAGSTLIVLAVGYGLDKANPIGWAPALVGAIGGVFVCAAFRLARRRAKNQCATAGHFFWP